MFPLTFKHVKNLLELPTWSFVTFAGFEERWLGFPKLCKISNVVPNKSLIINSEPEKAEPWNLSLKKNHSKIEQKQNKFLKMFKEDIGWDVEQRPVSSTSLDSIYNYMKSYFNHCESTIVFDITCMPRIMYFPLLKYAIASKNVRQLLVVYSEPNSYDQGSLHRGPQQEIHFMHGFDHNSRTSDAAWLPIIGFEESFFVTLHQTLKESYRFEGRVYPVLGFPAFDPSYYRRSINSAASLFFDKLSGYTQIRNRIRYGQANDPFDTYRTIMKLIDSHKKDYHWISSPMATKPMALGLLLAAIDRDISITIIQTNYYNENYSSGIGDSRFYLLKDEGCNIWQF